MWRGYEGALVRYGIAVCDEWIARGFNDSVRQKLIDREIPDSGNPPWIGDERVHESHRSSLLRKDPEFYGRLGWTPVHEENYWPVESKLSP